MKKDIELKKVEDIAMAVVPEEVDGEKEWFVYFLNLKAEPVVNVLIRSRGYGEIEEQRRETSTLRHLIERVEARSYAKVEIIKQDVFTFTNEYWVSFSHDSYLYDKKFIFVPESISPNLFTEVPLLETRGVMIN